MKYTPAEASKLLRTLTEEYDNLAARERSLDTFGAFANEDLAAVRPDHDYANYQAQLSELERKIRTVKHAINVFNVTTVLPETDGMTIDEALVFLPQLSEHSSSLFSYIIPVCMASRLRFIVEVARVTLYCFVKVEVYGFEMSFTISNHINVH